MCNIFSSSANYYIDLITPCFGDGVNPGTANYTSHAAYEILNPMDEDTYTFMTEFLKEIVGSVSKDKYVHLGMDEVIPVLCITLYIVWIQ